MLPCAWFDPHWMPNDEGWPENSNATSCSGSNFGFFFAPTTRTVTRRNFFPGAFAYHWHNHWDAKPAASSPFAQLVADLDAAGFDAVRSSGSSSQAGSPRWGYRRVGGIDAGVLALVIILFGYCWWQHGKSKSRGEHAPLLASKTPAPAAAVAP